MASFYASPGCFFTHTSSHFWQSRLTFVSLLSRSRSATKLPWCSALAGVSISSPPGDNQRNQLLVVEDDIHAFLQVLPADLNDYLLVDANRCNLLEVTMDLGKFPQALYVGDSGRQVIRNVEVTTKELDNVQNAIGGFGDDNRAGIAGTLHRISAIRSRKGQVIGLTCRVGRAIQGQICMVSDLLEYGESILFVGRPGVGKTTIVREISRYLSENLRKRVVIIDTSNEIGGYGDISHPAIGSARRLQVPEPSMQDLVMIEAVENHMPEVIIVDEIGTASEVNACRSITERGVMLIGTAHGDGLKNMIKSPTHSNLIGGVESIVLGDKEVQSQKCRKMSLRRRKTPTFPFLIEIREREDWVVHRTEKSVDALLQGRKLLTEIRRRDANGNVQIERWRMD